MALNSSEMLRERGEVLEDEFFRREDQRLIRRLNELKAAETSREALAEASGIGDPTVLKELMDLGTKAETLAALAIVPLVEVAWADGSLDPKERSAIVGRAGITQGTPAGDLLEAWLVRRPDPKLFTAWKLLIQAMCEQLGPEGAARLKTRLLERAGAVAVAAGGLFGIGKVSRAEAAMLAKLEAVFHSDP